MACSFVKPDILAGSFLKSLVLAILGMSAALNKTWRQFILWVEKWALWYAGTNLYIQIVVVVVEGGRGRVKGFLSFHKVCIAYVCM
jgi:hypothetical protein